VTYKPPNLTAFDKINASFLNRADTRGEFSCYLLVLGLGTLLGCIILYICGLADRWIFVMTAAGLFPVYVLAIGSFERSLLALLVVSLSMKMDIYLGYSESYTILKPGIPISLTIIVLLGVYIIWLNRVARGIEQFKWFPAVTIPIGFLTIWSILSILFSTHSDYVLARLPGVLTAFFLFYYIANFMKFRENIQFIIKWLAVTVIVVSIFGICQYSFGSSFNLKFLGGSEELMEHEYYNVTISRVSGFLVNANDLGLFLNGVLPLFFLCTIALPKRGLRLLCFISFAFGFVVLVLTYTRAAWLAFVFSIIIISFFIIKSNWRKNHRNDIFAVIIITITALLVIALFSPRVVTRLIEDDYGSAYSRIPLAKTAISTIRESPITGVGLGNYYPVISLSDPDPIRGTNDLPLDVHNMFLYVAAELGLPALILFLWVSIFFLVSGITAVASKNLYKSLFALGILSGLAGVYLHCIFENIFAGHPLYVFIFFLGGCLVGLKER